MRCKVQAIVAAILLLALALIVPTGGKTESGEGWLNDSGRFYGVGEYDLAITCIDRSLDDDKNDIKAWLYKGIVLNSTGKFRDAIVCFDKAIELDPLDSIAWYNRGKAFDLLYQYDAAFECYDRVLRIEKEIKSEDSLYYEALLGKGITLRKMGRYEEAIGCYSESLRRDPDDASALNNKGIALTYLGRYSEALDCFNRTIEVAPGSPDNLALAWINKGIAFLFLKKPDDAIECFDEAIKAGNGYEEWTAWFSKGVALKSQGREHEAAAAFDEAMSLRLGKDWYGSALHNLLSALGSFSEGLSIGISRLCGDTWRLCFNA